MPWPEIHVWEESEAGEVVQAEEAGPVDLMEESEPQ